MQYLKQSTAVVVPIGPFLDDTDGKTQETGLTIAQSDVLLNKNGAGFAQKNDSNSATHNSSAWYSANLNATDTNTLGRLDVAVHKSGALPVWREFMVVTANVYDSLFGGADYLDVNATQIEGSDATDQINAACDSALADYDAPTKAEMDSAFAALNDVSSTDVNTQVKAALDEANTELASIPTDTDSLRKMIQFVFEYWRNARTETAGVESLKKEDGTTELGSRTLADDGTTFTRGEMS